jgi:hypothetical protein
MSRIDQSEYPIFAAPIQYNTKKNIHDNVAEIKTDRILLPNTFEYNQKKNTTIAERIVSHIPQMPKIVQFISATVSKLFQ